MPILFLLLLRLRSIIICYSYFDIRLVQVFVTDYHENRKLSPFFLLQSLEKTTSFLRRLSGQCEQYRGIPSFL